MFLDELAIGEYGGSPDLSVSLIDWRIGSGRDSTKLRKGSLMIVPVLFVLVVLEVVVLVETSRFRAIVALDHRLVLLIRENVSVGGIAGRRSSHFISRGWVKMMMTEMRHG